MSARRHDQVRHAWRKGKPAAIAAHLLGIVAFAIALWTIGWYGFLLFSDGIVPRPGAVLLLVFVIPGTLLTLRNRLVAPTAHEVLAEDVRPPVLYFRTFRSDERRTLSVGRDKFETTLGNRLTRLGPFVAIGNPEDRLPPLGAARLYVQPDADWKTEVGRLLPAAQVVVFRAQGDLGEGSLWEIERVVAAVDPVNVLLAAPRRVRKGGDLARLYQRFVESVVGVFPHPLPPWRPDGVFVAFDARWVPYWLERKDTYLDRNDADYAMRRTLDEWILARLESQAPPALAAPIAWWRRQP